MPTKDATQLRLLLVLLPTLSQLTHDVSLLRLDIINLRLLNLLWVIRCAAGSHDITALMLTSSPAPVTSDVGDTDLLPHRRSRSP
eukprot:scaffold4342_cov234-Pinguiococcus_pyrenoidosus.AAC.5